MKVCLPFDSFISPVNFASSRIDGQIYVWHRDTGNLIKVLAGHGLGSVNAVAWNKGRRDSMFASVSDDKSVRVWEIPPQKK